MTRSNAREVAVHLIYEIDYTGEDPAQAIETRMDRSYYSGLSAENDVYAERPSKKQMDYIRSCWPGCRRSWLNPRPTAPRWTP